MCNWKIETADVLDWAASYDGPKFHALLCDPPYHLTIDRRFAKSRPNRENYAMSADHQFGRLSRAGFMGQKWDGGDVAYRPETWAALAQHLLPGAFGMVFASSRGWHRLAIAIEDSGLRIHPSIFCWAQGQGFCKATNIHIQLEKRLCYEYNRKQFYRDDGEPMRTEPPFRHPLADRFYGHRYGGQALAPKVEPIIVFQKPYEGKPVDCITETGAGALNIDGARIGTETMVSQQKDFSPVHGNRFGDSSYLPNKDEARVTQGRWPANFVLICTCSAIDWCDCIAHPLPDCPARKLGEQSGKSKSSGGSGPASFGGGLGKNVYGKYSGEKSGANSGGLGDVGTVARYFFQADWSYEIAERLAEADPVHYCPKAGRKEKDMGLPSGQQSSHPTVKPITLCRWLATLLLPPSEYAPRRILIPFSGTSSEGIGAGLAGWDEITMIEMVAEYVTIAEARMQYWMSQPEQLRLNIGSDK